MANVALGMAGLSLTAYLALAGTALAAPRYAVTDLGTLGGPTSAALGINNHGDVVGESDIGHGFGAAFLYRDGAMTNIGFSLGGENSGAGRISDTGYVSGTGRLVTNNGIDFGYRGFVEPPNSDGIQIPLLSPEEENNGEFQSGADDVNDVGQVVGSSDVLGSERHAFLFDARDGSIKDLGSFGGDYAEAYAINNLGQIVGVASDATRSVYGFRYENGTMNNIGQFEPTDINDNGVIAGTDFDHHAVIDDDDNIIELGVLPGMVISQAHAINLKGEAVGTSSIDFVGTDDRAFLYTDGQLYDLNSLIDPSFGWFLADATDINDAGQIVGTGTNPDGITRAFLLTPLPEPSCLALILLPAFTLARRTR